MSTIKHIKVDNLTAIVEVDDFSGAMLGTPVVDDRDPTPEEIELVRTAIINKSYIEMNTSADDPKVDEPIKPVEAVPPVDENKVPKYMKVGDAVVTTDGAGNILTFNGRTPTSEELTSINENITNKTYTALPDLYPEQVVVEPEKIEAEYIDVRHLRVKLGEDNSIVSVISVMSADGEKERPPTAEELALIQNAIADKTYVLVAPDNTPPEQEQPVK
jgi:hypothetical protein